MIALPVIVMNNLYYLFLLLIIFRHIMEIVEISPGNDNRGCDVHRYDHSNSRKVLPY
jgi:hypothetical protein